MRSNFIDVWSIPFNLDVPETFRFSEDERKRTKRLLPALRRAFIASHYGLRCVLSRYLDLPPEQIDFEVNSYNKPSVRGTSGIRFNLTHSEELALCAVTRGRSIGVDLEFVRPIADQDKIVSTYFASAEYRQFSLLSLSERPEAFLALWTRKEAFVKALGKGMYQPLNAFQVPLGPLAVHQRLPIIDVDSGKALDWSLFSFTPASHYMGAVVVEGEVEDIPTLRQFPDG